MKNHCRHSRIHVFSYQFFIFVVCPFLRRSFLFLYHNKVPVPFIFINLGLLRIIESVPRAFGHCAPLRAVLRTKVSTVSFFLQGALVTSARPPGGSPDPSVCPTGGDSAPVLGGGDFTVYLLMLQQSPPARTDVLSKILRPSRRSFEGGL